MNNKDLIKIRDMLTELAKYIDNTIDKDLNGCLHEENVINLSTMGNSKRKFQCFDCNETWEEEFEDEFIRDTIGK